MSLSPQDPVVLFVDDDEANRRVFDITFGTRFPLAVCEGPESALQVVEHRPVAVLLADQGMSSMSGHELLRRVRERSPDTVGVIIAAYDALPPLLESFNEQLVARYLIKPWRTPEIEATVAWGFEVYRLGREKAALQMKLAQGERLTILGSIAAGVLHDLKQPLTVLQGNLDLLGQLASGLESAAQPSDGLRAELEGRLADASAATERLTALVESAQRYLALGRSSMAAGPGDAGLAARYAATLCHHEVAAHGGLLSSHIPDHLPPVRLGTAALTQVLVHLLVNAAQALHSGQRQWVKLEVIPETSPLGVRILVSDNGRGMTPETLMRACTAEPLDIAAEVGSAGLGLFSARQLITHAGGQLSLASEPGRGTTATLFLPSALEATEKAVA
ncbi:MAG TPA: ATP-binding protein [Polyangia bacterium]|jgi:signal transduction histidine kinase|nr:ATP-binding protein [Polyangia bacterium]